MNDYYDAECDKNQEELEVFIDRVGLYDTMGLLYDICHGKAEHFRSNWQDENSAKAWERQAKYIDKTRVIV